MTVQIAYIEYLDLSSSRYPHISKEVKQSDHLQWVFSHWCCISWFYHSGFVIRWLLQPSFSSLFLVSFLSPFHNFLVEHFWIFWKMTFFISHHSLFSSEVVLHFSCICGGFSITHLGKVIRPGSSEVFFQKVHSAQKRWPVQVCIQCQQMQGLYHERIYIHPRGPEGLRLCHWSDISLHSPDFSVHKILLA